MNNNQENRCASGGVKAKPFVIVLLLVCFVVSGCMSASNLRLNAEQKAAVRHSLLSVTEAYNAAWESLDYEQISAFHGTDFTYYRRGAVDSDSYADFERAFHENVATQITTYWADMSDTWVNVLSQNAGVVAINFRGGVETPDGETPDGEKHDYNGALTYVLERIEGRWKITHIHESEFIPESP